MIDRIVEELQTLKVDSELRERDEAARERDEARCLVAEAADALEEANAFLRHIERQRDAANLRTECYAKRVDVLASDLVAALSDVAALRKVCAELHARNGAMVEALALVVLR